MAIVYDDSTGTYYDVGGGDGQLSHDYQTMAPQPSDGGGDGGGGAPQLPSWYPAGENPPPGYPGHDPTRPYYSSEEDWKRQQDWRNQSTADQYAGPNQASHGLDYWASQGVDPAKDMFDERGQLRPGWVRTADGYERSGSAQSPSAQANALFPRPDAPNPSDYPAPKSLQPWTGKFTAPSAEDVTKTPGFEFELGTGIKALQRSAASRGTLLTGGTLKDLTGYAQGLASTRYGEAYNRAFNQYDTERTDFLTNEANRYSSERANRGDSWSIGSDYFNQGRANRLDDFDIWHSMDTDYWNRKMDLAHLGQPKNPY